MLVETNCRSARKDRYPMAMYRASSNTSFISIGGSLEGNRAREAVGGCGADGAFFLSGPESTEEEFGCMYLSFLSPPEVTGDHGTRSYALFEDRRGGQLDTLPWSSMSSKISKRPRKGARRILRLVETDLRLRGKTDHHTAPTTEERKQKRLISQRRCQRGGSPWPPWPWPSSPS